MNWETQVIHSKSEGGAAYTYIFDNEFIHVVIEISSSFFCTELLFPNYINSPQFSNT